MTVSLQSDKWFKESRPSLPNSANSSSKYHTSLPVEILTSESIFTSWLVEVYDQYLVWSSLDNVSYALFSLRYETNPNKPTRERLDTSMDILTINDDTAKKLEKN